MQEGHGWEENARHMQERHGWEEHEGHGWEEHAPHMQVWHVVACGGGGAEEDACDLQGEWEGEGGRWMPVTKGEGGGGLSMMPITCRGGV